MPRSPSPHDSDAASSALAVREPLMVILHKRLTQLLAGLLAPVLNESFARVREGPFACAVPLLDDSIARVPVQKIVLLLVVRDDRHTPVLDNTLGPMLHVPFDAVLNGPLEPMLLDPLLDDSLVLPLDEPSVAALPLLDKAWVPVAPLLVNQQLPGCVLVERRRGPLFDEADTSPCSALFSARVVTLSRASA
ncbi:hypothetical protein AURDEDRAFT_173700 [Auricularia subglabra TFB-10046 SS5]|nr:hypothetical protein AURDEDRAFT_173700 [Auricularia subglabra TFB-10046 SS5]